MADLHIAWAALLLRTLARSGVRDVVVSPGSRSTPLALAAHDSPDLRVRFLLDERTAAFFALGQARVTGRPTALVCTSGTAAAHYFPAVIEASMSAVPLLAITADRPWELQNTGASQTIDQTRLFGDFARAYFALGAPEPTDAALRALVRTAAQAVARATGPLAGPVQINAPFRKPLEPSAADAGDMAVSDAARAPTPDLAARRPTTPRAAVAGGTTAPDAARAPTPDHPSWLATWDLLMGSGPTRSIVPTGFLDPAAFEECARLIARAERGLLVCGPAPAHGDLAAHRREILALARLTGFPILAEATSQVRFGLAASPPPRATTGRSAQDVSNPDSPALISCFDALLRSPALRARLVPDVILEIGAPPTSAGYAQLLAEHPRCPRFVLASPGWTDPTSTATSILHADVAAFRAALRVHLTGLPEGRGAAWSRAFASMDARALAALEDTLSAPEATTIPRDPSADRAHSPARPPPGDAAPTPHALSLSTGPHAAPDPGAHCTLSEAAVARAVIEACPPDSILVLGNSSPVRDIDAYCPASARPLRVLHQRGASGIDGLVSGAAGALAASAAPVTLLLGDLSFLHDLGGLAAARSATTSPPGDCLSPLVIVVVNNGGGRIFEQLPIARAIDTATFERCFATPEPLDLAAAARAFGLPFERAETPESLALALGRAHAAPAATLIEAVVPPHGGAARLRDLWSRTARIPSPPRDSESSKPPDKSRKDAPS